MAKRTKKINEKLKQLGKPLGINGTDAIKAKRTIKNIAVMAIIAGVFGILGGLISPGGAAGFYYSGGSLRDFHLLFRGLF